MPRLSVPDAHRAVLQLVDPSDDALQSKIEEQFRALSGTWLFETRHLSSVTEISVHPAYQRIIGMGPVVVPLILRELERAPNHWFWALRAITGQDPVKAEDRGRVKKMAEAWIAWARSNGYSW